MGYYQVNVREDFREEMESFIEEHPEMGFDNPKELMMHATRSFMIENSREVNKEEFLDWIKDELFNQ
jgi:hypothetical protein